MVNPRKEIQTPSSRCGGPRCEREMRVMMVVRGVDIVRVIAMRTTALRVPTTVVSIPVRIPLRIPPEIQLFHFQEDLQKNNRGPMRRPPHPIHKIKDKLGLVIKGNVSRNPSRRYFFSFRWDRDITVMMVMQIIVIVQDIAMRTTLFRVPTALEGMPVRIIHERGAWHVHEDLSKNNRGPMRKRVSP